MRVLIIEDAPRLRETLTDGLRESGYAVDAVDNGRQGLVHARTTEYDVIVLDLMLPSVDGLTLLRELRASGDDTPVLILSARDRTEHRVEGLRAGADDYVVKPFAFAELLARLEALCRRSKGLTNNAVRIGGVVFDLGSKLFTVGGAELGFTPREGAVLEHLFLNAGRVVSRTELEEHIYSEDRQVWSNTIDSAIAAIRRKLADAGELVRTRRGLGYQVGKPARDTVQP